MLKGRMSSGMAAGVLVGAMVFANAAVAFAGEKTGNGKDTAMRGHANSECGFSGLDDNDPSEGGDGVVVPGKVQNWGHAKDAPFIVESRGASHVVLNFGGEDIVVGCNAHEHPQK